MLFRMLACLLCTLTLLAEAGPGQAEGSRVALVIGNSEYTHATSLENPRNDAADMAAALKRLGFKVITGIDLDKANMDRTIRDFAAALTGAKVGMFFYAGHGLQVSGQNYLVPIDAKLTTNAGLDFETVRLELVHRTMERETSTNIIFLDACRDNPLSRNLARAMGTRSVSIGKGLAVVESGEGTLISFSTQPGNVALDGTGRNSPYAAALIKHITTEGEDLPSILINVRNDVMRATERRQVPWEHSAMTARFFFSEPRATKSQEAELALWNKVKDSTEPAVLDTYLRKYPQGSYAVVARTLVAALERRQEMERAARPEPATDSDQPTSQSPPNEIFDGRWEIYRSGTRCRRAEHTFQLLIRGGRIGERGSVTSVGTFKYTDSARSGKPNEFSGTLNGAKGSGTFAVRGGNCHGTWTAKRIDAG